MIEDLRDLPEGAELEADVCVVGAGAAGIALARELTRGSRRVLVLESGGLRAEAGTDELNRGESSGMDPASLTEGRGRLLGGATSLWAGQCVRPEPVTYAGRPWVGHSGWPFGEAELAPYVSRAEQLLGIAGELYDERVWDAFGVPRPAVDPARVHHSFTVWCPQPHLGRLYRRELAAAANVRLLLHATATELVTSSEGLRFDSLRVSTPEGRAALVRAPLCVLCCGAIENGRLLLASGRHRAAGIGNEHDVVGRYFQEHPNGHTAVVEGGDVRRLQELYGMLYRGRLRYLPRMALSPARQRDEQVLAGAAHPVFHYGDDSGVEAARRVYRALRARRRPRSPAAELTRMGRDGRRLALVAYRRVARGRAPRLAPERVTLHSFAEQAPNPDSRVTLASGRDRLGVPLPRVDWRLGELDRRTAEVTVATVAGEFRRLGLGDVRAEPWLGDAGWAERISDQYHQMGTTRLGRDPRTSVVDPDCRVHGVHGLYVSGASVFPVAGFTNPTLLIAALAIRLADHLERTWPATSSI